MIAMSLLVPAALFLVAGPVRAQHPPRGMKAVQQRLNAMQQQLEAWETVLNSQDAGQPKVQAAQRALDRLQQQLDDTERTLDGRPAMRLQNNPSGSSRQNGGCHGGPSRQSTSQRQLRTAQCLLTALESRMNAMRRQMKAFQPATEERALRAAGSP
jgi:hypothetical protein